MPIVRRGWASFAARKLLAGVRFENGHSTYTLDFVLPQPRYLIGYDPGYSPAKVDDLVHGEGHDPRREHIVLHICVPGCPGLFQETEVCIVGGNVLEVIVVGCGRVEGRERRVPVLWRSVFRDNCGRSWTEPMLGKSTHIVAETRKRDEEE